MFAQMSFLTRVFTMFLCCLAVNYASGILFKYVSRPDNDKECSYSTSQNTDNSRHLFTVILICFVNSIYSLYTSIFNTEIHVSHLRYAFHFCRNMITVYIFGGKAIKWIKKSIVHRHTLEKLVETLKYKPNAVQTIEGYNVCFEETFEIGDGSDGTKVFVGLGNDGVEVAIKRLNSEFKFLGEHEKKMMTLQKLQDNPYVLTYRFHAETDEYAYLITDLQDETLKQFVGKSNLADLQEKGPTILRQILLGIDALHDVDILHRDLKPENVLVNFEGKMVLGDFGICRRLQPDQTTLCGSKVIVPKYWMAVESLPNENDDDLLPGSEIRARYSKASDVQVLGMLFYFVLTKGKHPFGQHVFIVPNIIEDNYYLNDLMDADAKDLIEWMLQHNKLERPTVKQCLKHPYLISPEEKFKFLTAVGNEREIRTREEITDVSVVVQQLNAEASRTIPAWCENIDEEVYSYFSRDRVYSANVTGLLQFICDVQQQVKEEIPPPSVQLKFGTSRAYFLQVFPTLSMIVHGVLRKYPTWRDRDSLKEFF